MRLKKVNVRFVILYIFVFSSEQPKNWFSINFLDFWRKYKNIENLKRRLSEHGQEVFSYFMESLAVVVMSWVPLLESLQLFTDNRKLQEISSRTLKIFPLDFWRKYKNIENFKLRLSLFLVSLRFSVSESAPAINSMRLRKVNVRFEILYIFVFSSEYLKIGFPSVF